MPMMHRASGSEIGDSDFVSVEAKLEDRSERLRLALDAGSMGTFYWYPQEDRSEPDAQMLALLGLPPDTPLTRKDSIGRYVAPEDQIRFSAAVERAVAPGSDGVLHDDVRVVLPGGSQRWLAVSAQVYFEDGHAVRMVGTAIDITVRKSAEAALRRSEERQAFLLRLSDAIRPLIDADEIEYTVCHMLGEYLDVNRVSYAEVDETNYTVRQPFTHNVPQRAGRFPRPPFAGPFLEAYRRGEAAVVDNIETDPRLTEEDRVRLRAFDIGAFVGAMIIKQGEWRSSFGAETKAPRHWTTGEIELVREVSERLWSAMERGRTELALRESESRLSIALKAGRMGTWRRNVRTGEEQWDIGEYELFGLDPDTPASHDRFLEAMHPDDRPSADIPPISAQPEGTLLTNEFRIIRPDGEIRWLVAHALAFLDSSGEPVEVIGVNQDITAQKEQHETMHLLLAELQHRVRNTLSVIRSIARRTAATSATPDDYAMHLEGRIDAFARVQAATTRDPAGGADLEVLVAEELRAAAAREGEQLSIAGPQVRLSVRAATTIGLAIHELTTNSVKYGALADDGRLDVSWEIDGDLLRFHWHESDLKTPLSGPSRRGFGTEILESTLAYEFKARTTLEFRPDGLRCDIEFPLSRILQT